MRKESPKANMRYKSQQRRRMWKRIVTTLAVMVVFCTVYALVLPAITLADEPICGQKAHEHTDACYRTEIRVFNCAAANHVHQNCTDELGNMSCGFGQVILHSHNSKCYDELGKLICQLEERDGHIHDETCQGQKALICDLEETDGHSHTEACAPVLHCKLTETAGHTHGEGCYETRKELTCQQETASEEPVCGLTEADAHVHAENCYEYIMVLQCELEESDEHTHEEACYTREEKLVCQKSTEPHAHSEECYAAAHEHTDACYEERQSLICQEQEQEAHTHSDECYSSPCTLEEAAAHTHTDACYDETQVTPCQLEQVADHEHTPSCYDENGNRICGLIEGVVHVHDDSCFRVIKLDTPELICKLPEHIHVDSCYLTPEDLPPAKKEFLCDRGAHEHAESCYDAAGTLICTIPEHVHDVACKVPNYDPEADVETAEDWESTFKDVELSGRWGEDLLAIAKTQLDYRESKQNVILTEDGSVMGYTRYGAWYGAPYIDWSAAFVSFCAHYAQVEGLPQDASCESYYEKLKTGELFREADKYLPRPGDLILLDIDSKDDARKVGAIGIVAEMLVNEQGELTTLKILRGDVSDKVQLLTYDLADGGIIGYGEVPAGDIRTLLCGKDHEHTDDCYGYKLYYTDDTLQAEVIIRGAEDLPADVDLQVRKITPAADPGSYGAMLSAVNRKMEDSPYFMGDVGFFSMELYQNGESYSLPEGATTAVSVSFTNPVFSPEAMEGAAKVETYLLTPKEKTQTPVKDARDTAGKRAAGVTEEEARYLVEQVEEDTYVNASGGLTGVSFETNMITTFATVLSNTTKEGQFWERVFSTSDIVSGGTYMIVSAEGGFALRGNESNNYSRVMVQAQDGEEDPDAAWDANPERNTRYYTITYADGSPVDNNVYWTFTGSGNKYVVRNQATSIYLALSRIRTGGTFIPRYTEYFMHTVSAELTLSYITPENVWRISNYSDLRNAGTGAFAKRSASSTDGSYYSSGVNYYNTEDMLIFKLSDVTSLTVPPDVLGDNNSGSGGEAIAPDKPDYGEFIVPTGGLTGQTEVTEGGTTVKGEYYSDPATSDIETQFRQESFEASSAIDGKVVTDKSVIYGADDYAAFDSYEPNTFSVALSTLGQEYEIPYQYMVKTPVDVVFVLDISGSMSSQSDDDDSDPQRIVDLCNAVNTSMKQILDDHEANRVGIAVYSSGAWQMLPLDRYTADNDKYLVNNQKNYSHDPSDLNLNINFLQGAPSLRSESGVSYANVGSNWNQGVGTYTQAGIAMGNEIFEAIGDDTTYTTTLGEGEHARPYTVTRQPVFILLSDGEPTHSTPIYNDVLKGPHYGNGQSGINNGKGIHGYYTVLSANYYKRAVSIQYKKPVMFYSIGMGINAVNDEPLSGETANTGDNYKRAVLNPQRDIIENLTADRAKDITVDQLKGMLLGTYADDYVQINQEFPEAWYGVPHAYEPVLKPNPYADNFSYADKAYFGDLPEEELEEIFSEIYQSSVSVTPYGFVLYKNSSVNIVDHIGSGMEIKGTPVLRYNGVNYTNPKISTYENNTVYVYEGTAEDPYLDGREVNLAEITVTVTTDPATGDQTVYMYVPDTALPTYTPELIGRQFYYEQLPVRLIYQVGLTEESEQKVLNLSSTGGELTFYTNKWDDAHISTSTLLPSEANPFYYHIDGTEAPYREHHSLKSEDVTQTVDYHVDCHRDIETVAGEVLVEVIHKQGNNGKLVFRDDTIEIPVEKQWADGVNADIMNPIQVSLYKVTQTVKDNGEIYYTGTQLQTVTLSSNNDWKALMENLQFPSDGWQYAIAEEVPVGYVAKYSKETVMLTTDNGQTFFNGVLAGTDGEAIVITNVPAGQLPSTGGGGILMYTMGGFGLMLLAAGLLLYNLCAKRRREERFFP